KHSRNPCNDMTSYTITKESISLACGTAMNEPRRPTTAGTRKLNSLRARIWFARGSIVGAVAFAVAWTVLGALRPGYSVITQPISGLGVGPGAAWMNGAFVLAGLLTVAGVLGTFTLIPDLSTRRRWGLIVTTGLSGLGSVLCGLFTWASFIPHMVG